MHMQAHKGICIDNTVYKDIVFWLWWKANTVT